jgi:hypothetical protein
MDSPKPWPLPRIGESNAEQRHAMIELPEEEVSRDLAIKRQNERAVLARPIAFNVPGQRRVIIRMRQKNRACFRRKSGVETLQRHDVAAGQPVHFQPRSVARHECRERRRKDAALFRVTLVGHPRRLDFRSVFGNCDAIGYATAGLASALTYRRSASSPLSDYPMKPTSFPVDRRTMLKLTAVAGVAVASPLRVFGQAKPLPGPSLRTITDYLQTLARPDGGYAWGDQEISHLTPTFGAVGCYRVLQQTPPNKDKLVQYVRTHHPREVKKLEQERRIFDYQQVQALTWLNADASEFRPKIAALTQPLGYLKQYERHGYPVFQSELGAVMSHSLLGLPVDGIKGAFGALHRRTPQGKRQLQQHARRGWWRWTRHEHAVGAAGAGRAWPHGGKERGVDRVAPQLPAAVRRFHVSTATDVRRCRGHRVHARSRESVEAPWCRALEPECVHRADSLAGQCRWRL